MLTVGEMENLSKNALKHDVIFNKSMFKELAIFLQSEEDTTSAYKHTLISSV